MVASQIRQATILENCRKGHFHPHGTRKGSAMHVTTNTMDPPPMPSVLLRGEWSLGKVLDLYWKWGHLGDTYLGRCLAGLDPDDENEKFATLPPHFIEGMENVHIKEAMTLCFGTIISSWGHCSIVNALLLLLASMVYHSEFLFGYIADNNSHPFQSIPILHRPDLLAELKKLVTLDAVGLVKQSSGVPFRVKQASMLRKTFETLTSSLNKILEAQENMPQVIKDTVDKPRSTPRCQQ